MTDHPTTEPALRGAELGLLLALVVAARLCARASCPIYDDAFITYRYAENLAGGHGLVFNPGAAWEPVLGTTTVLYAAVLALLVRVGADVVNGSLAFNAACDLGTAALLAQLFRGRRLGGSVALLGFASMPQLVRVSVGGMEAPLFAFCALAACVALASRRPATAGFLAACTCLTRPEGVLLAGILFLACRRSRRDLVRFALPLLTIGAATVALLWAIYGSPISQSIVAKAAMSGGDALTETLARWKTILRESALPGWAYLPVLPIVLVGLPAAWKRGGATRLYMLFAGAIPASYLVARPHTWGWYYFATLIGWIIALACGAETVAARTASLASRPAVRWLRAFGPGAAAILAFGAILVVARTHPSPVVPLVYEPMMKWAAVTSAREPNAKILAADIGAIGLRWKGTVLDSEGLTWPAALRLKSPNRMIESEEPAYLLVVAERPRVQQLREDRAVSARYEPILRFSARGETTLHPSLAELDPRWSQDYLVYQRRRAP